MHSIVKIMMNLSYREFYSIHLLFAYFFLLVGQMECVEWCLKIEQTCNTTNTMANTETITTHAAMAIAVIAVVAGVMWPNPLLPFPSFDMLSLLLIPNRLSSPPPNCCCSTPLAMRRFPAGDAFIQPPEK